MKVLSTAANISQAFKNAGRVSEILGVLVKHGFADLIHRMGLSHFLPAKYSENERFKELPVAMRLRLSFEELGPTFVKLGQLLAGRPDLIPPQFIEEFERLQDDVAGLPFAAIKKQVESELKRPLDEVFASFEEIPMAAASIGQVHGAVLKTGERVAVKVQRPGIERLIQNDISILRGVAQLMEKYIPEARTINPTGLVEEFFKSILYETDFRVESNNMRRIRKNLEVYPGVAVPHVYPDFSSKGVLVLERFEGVRFSEREKIKELGINPLSIVELGAEVFFHMVMNDGVFHGDLHAGNLFILPDGKIGFIDFGIVGRLSRRVQDSIITMFIAIIDEDFETLAYEYTNLCQTTGETDIGELQKDLMDVISPYMGMPLGEVNVGRLLLQSTSIAVRHNLRVPRELMMLFKAIFTIEALGKKLEPNFDMLQVGTKLARKILTTRYSRERVQADIMMLARDLKGVFEVTPRLARRFLKTWSQNGFAFEVRDRHTAELAKASRVASFTAATCTMAAGLFATSIALLISDRGPFLFGHPVWGEVCFLGAMTLLGHLLWRMRKERP